MINISRTRVSDSWLTSLPLTPKGPKSLDTLGMITVESNRFSVTTVNSDLFPELLSWSAIIDAAQASSPRSQNIPSDVRTGGSDADTIIGPVRENNNNHHLSLPLFLDPTTIEVGLDLSCFDGLEGSLLYSPKDAFAELCWAGYAADGSSSSHSEPTSSSSPSKPACKRRPHAAQLAPEYSSEDTDSDSDSCKTFGEDDMIPFPVSLERRRERELPSYADEKSLFFDDDDALPTYIPFSQHHFTYTNPKETVSSFPVPPIRQKSVSRRLAAFCSNLVS